MYNRTYWVNHTTDQNGEVIQTGTLLDQEHFNNLEVGTADANIAARTLIGSYLQLRRTQEENDALEFAEILGESHTVTLTNSKSYPFNTTVTTPVTVALSTNRKNLYYSVETNVASFSGGLPGEIHVSGKALNGFKVAFDGSAKSVTLEIRIKGGMA